MLIDRCPDPPEDPGDEPEVPEAGPLERVLVAVAIAGLSAFAATVGERVGEWLSDRLGLGKEEGKGDD